MVAVKVIKNLPAYYHQARVEVGVLHMLNEQCDPRNESNIVRMFDYFVHQGHLCIVFEVKTDGKRKKKQTNLKPFSVTRTLRVSFSHPLHPPPHRRYR